MSGPLPARTFSVTIRRDWRAVYEAIWAPARFAHWAAGMAESHLREEDGQWLANGAEGPIRIRFTPRNDFGVMDHWVETDTGEIHVPLRVVENGDGAEVMLTLFRQPGMDDARFAADAKAINRDLATLRDWATRTVPA